MKSVLSWKGLLIVVLSAVIPLALTGCKDKAEHPESEGTENQATEHPAGSETKAEHPESDEADSEHPTGEETQSEHPESDEAASEHPDHPQ
jgi:uncharacterized protein involved in copper resistance